MREDPRPFAGVTIETHVVGRHEDRHQRREAAEVLLLNWPETGRGKPIAARFMPATRRAPLSSLDAVASFSERFGGTGERPSGGPGVQLAEPVRLQRSASARARAAATT